MKNYRKLWLDALNMRRRAHSMGMYGFNSSAVKRLEELVSKRAKAYDEANKRWIKAIIK